MSNVQIPNLPVAIALNGTEALEAVQSGTSVQTTVAGIAQYSYAYYPGFYISQLPAASSANSTDIFPVVQGSTGPNTGTTYKATVAQLFTSPIFTGTTTVGSNLVDYVTITGAANTGVVDTASPVIRAEGAATNIDVKVLGKGAGMLNSTKLYIGSSGARISVNENTPATIRFTTTYSGAGWQALNFRGNIAGALTSSLNGVVAAIADSDTVAAGAGNGMDFFRVVDVVQAGATGGRNALVGALSIEGDTTVNSNIFHVATVGSARATASFGGAQNSLRGDLFASNLIAGIATGSGAAVNSVVGSEIDLYATGDTEAGWMIGQQIVLVDFGGGVTHATRGWNQDNAFQFTNSPTVTTGWRTLISIGAVNGVWPLGSDSQIFTTTATGLGGPAYAVADGIAWKDITFGRMVLETSNASLDGNGNFGAQISAGVALQTRSAITAKTAIVNTITPIDGGLYNSISVPTLVVDAPPGGGGTATASITLHAAVRVGAIGAAGSGYAVGEVLTVVGGTGTAATFTVVKLTSGGTGVRSLKLLSAGSYTVLPGASTATTSSGAGIGCTVTLNATATGITVTSGGTNYPEFPPPTVRFSGGTVYRKLVARVTMTPTQAALVLNAGNTTQVDSLIISSGGPRIVQGTGVPPVILTLPRGTFYLRTDGAVGSTVYVSQGGGTWNAIAGV